MRVQQCRSSTNENAGYIVTLAQIDLRAARQPVLINQGSFFVLSYFLPLVLIVCLYSIMLHTLWYKVGHLSPLTPDTNWL